MKTARRPTVLLAAALAFAAAAAHAATYRVGPGRTYTQVSQVAGLLNPGDVVEVDGNATYGGILWTRSGTAGQPITIRGMASGAQRPVIDAGGANDAFRMDVNHYVVEDLVISNAAVRCVYLHGHNLTLRRVRVHTCAKHGILGADADTGDMLLTEVEVHNQGNPAAPSQFDHPIYIATDQAAYPNAVLRIEKSWIHDNYSGNSIKSRAKTLKVFYNWIEATNGQNHTIEAIGPDPGGAPAFCPVPNGANDAQLCTGEIVGNVLIARGNNANMMRLGSDGTGWTHGRYHVVNNTFIANGTFNSNSSAMIRAFGPIQSIELHNNIFWIQQGDSVGIRIVRDAEAEWVNGRRVTGTRNLVTGSPATYATGIPAQQIAGLTQTIFTTTGTVFANVSAAALAAGTAIDARLAPGSPARLAGTTGSTSTAGYEIPAPTNLPTLQPPLMRPSPGAFLATTRPPPTNDAGGVVAGTIGLGALEYSSVPGFDPAADDDGDGIPNGVELTEGRNYTLKDNDIFANPRLFAMQQYRDFLAREGDTAGVTFWTGQVQTGAQSRGQAIESFFNSPEFQGTISPVARLYFAYFLRIPDYSGLNFWIGYYRAGNSLAAISDIFANSAEFSTRYGALTNGQFVDLVYQNVLGRPADAGGKAFWQGQLDTNAQNRGQVMLGFSESDEYKAAIASEVYVTMMYMGMLRRGPDAPGFNFWVGYKDAGNSGLALIDGFLASGEYRARFLP